MDFKHHPIYCRAGYCGQVHPDHNPLGEPISSCREYNDGYQSGIAEGEARATRAIVQDLNRLSGNMDEPTSFRIWVSQLADRYKDGAHLAAKAEGKE